MGMENVKKFRK